MQPNRIQHLLRQKKFFVGLLTHHSDAGATLVLRRLSRVVQMARNMESPMDTPPSMTRPRILLADGNPMMRQHLTRFLGEYYEIDAAGDASAALSLALKRAPDLIVADV